MHIFISYAKKDTRELALSLADSLNALEGVSAWVDKSLKAGESWELRIQREIDRCDAMIVLYSPDINRHKMGEEVSYVLTEITYAKRVAKKRIIPIMAQLTDPPISMILEHYIDFTFNGLALSDLVDAVCDELGTRSQSTRMLSRVEGILAAPFEWINIPAGNVNLLPGGYVPSGGQRYTIPAFDIGKYPVTNAQYAAFIEAGGYQQREWWTKNGWQEREKEQWTEPRYWLDSHWNDHEYPVVGVSWYEVDAFCHWLSHVSGESIALPSEGQWQRAAAGDDDLDYPWGNQWLKDHCNNNVGGKGLGRTSAIRKYLHLNESAFRVVDMSGNVWEWCSTDFETGDVRNGGHNRVLRGGSWMDFNSSDFRCDYRDWLNPHSRYYDRGFRIVRLG